MFGVRVVGTEKEDNVGPPYRASLGRRKVFPVAGVKEWSLKLQHVVGGPARCIRAGLDTTLKSVLRRLTWLQCTRDTSQEKAGGRNTETRSCYDSNCSGGEEEWRQ